MKNAIALLAAPVIGGLLLAACQPKSADQKQAPALAAPVPDEYFLLKGTVGGEQVTVHLTGDPQTGVLSGDYFYDKNAEPIAIHVESRPAGGSIVFAETFDGGEPDRISGKMAADGSFSGTWSDGSGKRQLPVAWVAAQPAGAVAFKGLLFRDSLLARPSEKEGPMAAIEQNWLLPAASTEAALKTFLEKEIRLGMLGDSLGGLVDGPAAAFELAKKQFFEGYAETAKDWDPADSTQSPMMYTLDEMDAVRVFFNENNLLTLGFFQYAYTGGAHGNYGTAVRSYDLATRKRLALADVFKPGYEKELRAALDRAACRKFGVKLARGLAEVLFEETIPLNNNFGLTSKGIFFDYVPYEIASYAQGEIQIFVPFEEIKGLLKSPR